jgi:hypothetical protein
VRVFRYIKTLNIEKERALLPGRVSVSVRVRACLSLFTNEAQADEREREIARKEGRKEALKRALTLHYLSLSLSLSPSLSPYKMRCG